MDLFAAAFLGILQGLTEFLPVSSSAHLLLVPWFFHWQHEGLAFDVAVHIGTMVAILAFFWRDWIRLAHETILGLKEGNLFGNPDRRLAWFLIVGTLPAITVGLTLEKTLENHLRSPLIIWNIASCCREKKQADSHSRSIYMGGFFMDWIQPGACTGSRSIPKRNNHDNRIVSG
jgi:undecaprenyl pyrophosphate phosphatase UppP